MDGGDTDRGEVDKVVTKATGEPSVQDLPQPSTSDQAPQADLDRTGHCSTPPGPEKGKARGDWVHYDSKSLTIVGDPPKGFGKGPKLKGGPKNLSNSYNFPSIFWGKG